MGHIRSETPLVLEGLLQVIQEVIETFGDGAQFPGDSIRLHPCREFRGGNGGDLAGDGVQGAQSLTDDHLGHGHGQDQGHNRNQCHEPPQPTKLSEERAGLPCHDQGIGLNRNRFTLQSLTRAFFSWRKL